MAFQSFEVITSARSDGTPVYGVKRVRKAPYDKEPKTLWLYSQAFTDIGEAHNLANALQNAFAAGRADVQLAVKSALGIE